MAQENFDLREVKQYQANPGLLSLFDTGQAYDGGWMDAFGNVVDAETYQNALKAKKAYNLFNQDNDLRGIKKKYSALGPLGLDLTDPDIKDYYSNREIYSGISEQLAADLAKRFKANPEKAASFISATSPYDPYSDYRNQGYTDFVNRSPKLIELYENYEKAKDKEFNQAVVSSIITFLTAGAGAALGGASAASGAASGAASVAPSAAGSLGGGGLFVGGGGLLGSTGFGFADALINGAIQNGLISGVTGGDPFKGALSGAVTSGAGSLLKGADFGLGTTGNDALAGALKAGISSGVSGGNPLTAALLGGAATGIGSAFSNGIDFGGGVGNDSGVSSITDIGGTQTQIPNSLFDISNTTNSSGPLSLFDIGGYTGGGSNVSDFIDFSGGSNFDFTNSIIPDFGGAFSSLPGSFFDVNDYLNGGFDFSNLDAFSGLDPANLTNLSFLDGYAPFITDPSLNQAFLNALDPANGQYIDLSNSDGALVGYDANAVPSSLSKLISQYGAKAVQALLGGSGGGALSGLLGGGSGGGLSGGGGGNVPQFYTDYIKDLFAKGKSIANQPFQSYQGALTWPDSDISKYINPYVEQALDPVAERLKESAGQERRRNNALSISRGAFGNTRNAITDSLTERALEDNLRQLYGQGYSQAYTLGQNQFNADRNFGYNEFVRGQDFPLHQFDAYTTAVRGANVGGLQNEPNKLAQGFGALTSLYGLYNSIFN